MASKAFKVDPETAVTEPEILPTEPAPDENAVAARAYLLWEQRGCPIGSDQEDWFRAERELKSPASMPTAA